MPLTDLSNPDVLLRENWNTSLLHGADGTPLLPPNFVAEAGPRVWLIDVRRADELDGAVGHIPGVWWMPVERITEVATKLAPFTPVVLVCDDGRRSTVAARFLHALGMTTVAAMQGGMIAWRTDGYGVSRDPRAAAHELAAPKPGHGSDGRLLQQSRRGTLTRDAIVAHLGDPAKVRRIKLAALLVANQTSCVDGREDRAIIGTPGGDAGELVLGLAATENITGTSVDLAHLDAITRAFADTFGGIYLHTDNKALNTLARALRSDPRLEGAVANLNRISEWETFLRRPPVEIRDALLEHLLEPAHIGCGHLKLAMTHPDAYQVRAEIVTAVFRAFYRQLWAGAPDLEWVVLGGEHAEGAVANVVIEGALWPFSGVPMVAPSIGGVQMFVNHPDVVAYFRAQTSRFFSRTASSLLPLGKHDEQKLAARVTDLGAVQALETLKTLAAGLPVFELRFAAGGPVEVTEGDTIPAA
ncbi:MAG: rhodanese-like domain-containing protein [Myxococcota bacterium]